MLYPFDETKILEVSPEKVKNVIDNKENAIILDVRTTIEYTNAHIKGSILLPVDEVLKKIVSVIPEKTAVVYVYCFSGSRSITAVKQMMNLGYTNVFNMPNGILAWRKKGYKLVGEC